MDLPEPLPGGATWWQLAGADGVTRYVLELPPHRPDGAALELHLAGVGACSWWTWLTERGALLRTVAAGQG
jgi:hypothetical protein